MVKRATISTAAMQDLREFLSDPFLKLDRFMVTGSRDWTDWVLIRDALRSVHDRFPNAVMANGKAYGADCIAGVMWSHVGGWVQYYPPDYQRHGKSATFIRNDEMVNSGVGLCLSFCRDESNGTAYTREKARGRGIPTFNFTEG